MTARVKNADAPSGGVSEQGTLLASLLNLLLRFQRFGLDILGVLLLSLAAMTVMAMLRPDLTGGALLFLDDKLRLALGLGRLWVALLAGALGLAVLRRWSAGEVRRIRWGRVLALEIAAFASLALLSVAFEGAGGIAPGEMAGGSVGWGLAEMLRIPLRAIGLGGRISSGLLWGVLFLASLGVGLGLAGALGSWARRRLSGLNAAAAPALVEAPAPETVVAGTEPAAPNKKKKPFIPPEFRQKLPAPPRPQDNPPLEPGERDPRLPGYDLLASEPPSKMDERNINLTAGLIVKTLAEFGIPAKVVGYRVGPTVTQFAVEPGFLEKEKPGNEGDIARQKIRVAQISSLQRDLAMALSAERLRIEAPVPGRPYVGIEVPNTRATIVRLRSILESEAFQKMNAPLGIGLGRDVSGQPVVADLARMPHLLVAGTTGSGKSVCIAAITASLVMNNHPADLRLVMIDPKMVELVRFNGLPHLLGKVETNLERILAVLRWTVAEMDRRYKLLESARARNIDTYNRKLSRKKGEKPLPRIVVLIDELADLMMSAPDQTEHNLVRLAQMARAVGIHLVVATQRPSTDVVTGLIKANFPARLAFAVASSVDSRVILDAQGAESLLGRGDMLFMPPDITSAIRCQGALVADPEIERLVNYWQQAASEQANEDGTPPWDDLLEQEAVQADRDNLVEQAIEIIRETGRANASMLQRRLRIGYPRAARLMDELEELGVIAPAAGGREREVLIDRESGEEDS